MNIAIIGSNGFIGRHLTQTLLKNPENKLFLFGKSNDGLSGSGLPYTRLDFSDRDKIKAHFSGIDLVYYLASASIPSSTWDKPLMEIETNLIPFVQFMESIAGLQVKKIAFVSSAGTVYGPTPEKVSEDSVKNPFSPYGIIKLTMEHYLEYFKLKHGVHYDIYRVSNVYGAGQDTSKGLGIINTFLEQIMLNRAITIFGNGENTRNYIYVQDVAEFLNLSAISDLKTSHIYNLSSNDTLTINELVGAIKEIVSEDFEVIYKDTRGSDNLRIMLDNSRIKKALPGYAFTSIQEGITKTYTYLKEQVLKKN